MKRPPLTKIFFTFLKIGAFTFGGGYAMLPLIRDAVVVKEQWISEEGFVDLIGITQSVPGVLAVNSAIFLGYQIAGLPGAFVATLGAVLPSFFIILALAAFFQEFSANKLVARAFKGIRPAVVALIAHAVFQLGKRAIKNGWALMLMLLVFFLNIFLGVNPVFLLLGSALTGLVYASLNKDWR
jgi:chromate transporter